MAISVAQFTCTHAHTYSRCKERQTIVRVRICVRGLNGGDDSVEGSSCDVARLPAEKGRGKRTLRCQMTPVARPPRLVHPRPYTRCSTVLFLRVLAYAHKHIHARDAVAYARTLGRVCVPYASIVRHNERTYTHVHTRACRPTCNINVNCHRSM